MEIKKRPPLWLSRSFQLTFTISLAVIVFLLVNFLSNQHYWRSDWSRPQFYKLSAKSRSLLNTITNNIDIIVLVQPNLPVFSDIECLLKEYTYRSHHLKIQWIDPDRDLAQTEGIAHKYHISEGNVIIVASENQHRVIQAKELLTYQDTQLPQGKDNERPHLIFCGEQLLTCAIQGVSDPREPTIYFLTGHGEREINDFDQRRGLSHLMRQIKSDNINIKRINLSQERIIPKDCEVLVIAGPTTAIPPPELDTINNYLERNGRLLVLVEAGTDIGLGQFLKKWAVRVGKNLIVDPTRTLSGREIFISEYAPHPITKKLKGITSVFYYPCAVEPIPSENRDSADYPQATALAFTSKNSWEEATPDESRLAYTPTRDRPGPLAIAASVERGPGVNINVRIRPTRLVVFGDVGFVTNGGLTGGDADFFMNAVNWLLERDDLLTIATRPVSETRIVLNHRQRQNLFLFNIACFPAILGLVGFIFWIRRRE